MRKLRSPERVLITCALLGLTAAACVKPGPPGVEVAKLSADIVFGVKETPPPAAPANTPTATSPVFEEPAEEFNEKILEIPDFKPLPRPTPTASAAPSDCPPAALTAFPKDTAEVTVKGTPTAGVYRFKRAISVAKPGEPSTRFEGFEQHVVRRVTPTPNKAYEFSYEVVQPDNINPGNFVVTTFRVNSNPAVVQSVNRPGQTVIVVPVPGVEQYVTDPNDEPGIFVDRIETQDVDGATQSVFDPVRPIKYMPLEEGLVRPGQSFESIGIDAETGNVIRHQGTVTRKTRVDACGEIVEGWLVEAVQTFSSGFEGAYEKAYSYNVATQYGALLISELGTISSGETALSIDVSLAGLTPAPLPENLK